MRLRKTHPRTLPTISIAAMIDVVFLLIIFFMTVSQFSRVHAEQVALPDADKGVQKQHWTNEMALALSSDGRMACDGALLTLDDFRARLAAMSDSERSTLRVTVRADKAASWKAVREVLTTCSSHGVTHVTSAVLSEASR